MPLNPIKTDFLGGVLVNCFYLSEVDTKSVVPPQRRVMSPTGICVYKLPQLPINANTSLAEYYSRRNYYGDMKDFVPHFYIDNVCAWQILEIGWQGWHAKNIEENRNKLGIVICGDSKKAEENTARVIAALSKKFNLGLNAISSRFAGSENFREILARRAQITGMKIYLPIEEREELAPVRTEVTAVAAQPKPKITTSFYVGDEWQDAIKGKAIQAIKVSIDSGELFYRVHLLKGGWLSWTNNGEAAGSIGRYIDGIQVKYISDKYQLFYNFSNLNKNPIAWRTTNFTYPTGQKLDSINFKIEEI